MTAEARDPGIDVQIPESSCEDGNCPFHGSLSLHGRTMTGTIAETKMDGTVVVEEEHVTHVPKFERYMRRRSRYLAHHPPCIDVEPGDEVTIAKCRPLSKTVSFVLVERLEDVS